MDVEFEEDCRSRDIRICASVTRTRNEEDAHGSSARPEGSILFRIVCPNVCA